MADTIGRKRWAIADGYIPGWSNGGGGDLESHDALCVLNAGEREAHLEITLFFTDREPVGPYRFPVAARRTEHLRPDAFQDPAPVPKETPYAVVVESDEPVVVQYTRIDTRQAENALLSTIAFAGER